MINTGWAGWFRCERSKGPARVATDADGSGPWLHSVDVEASTIADFNGVTALAYMVGTARGNDGSSYNLEADVRVFEGQYVGADGAPGAGTFAFM